MMRRIGKPWLRRVRSKHGPTYGPTQLSAPVEGEAKRKGTWVCKGARSPVVGCPPRAREDFECVHPELIGCKEIIGSISVGGGRCSGALWARARLCSQQTAELG